MGKSTCVRFGCGVQISELRSCVKETGEREEPFVKGFSLSLSFHLHTKGGSPFDPRRSNQVTYRLSTNYKVVSHDILYIVSNFQPNRTEVDFPIGLVRCPFSQMGSHLLNFTLKGGIFTEREL
jgi:hypothetical protein